LARSANIARASPSSELTTKQFQWFQSALGNFNQSARHCRPPGAPDGRSAVIEPVKIFLEHFSSWRFVHGTGRHPPSPPRGRPMRGATGVLLVAPHFVVGFGRQRPTRAGQKAKKESRRCAGAGETGVSHPRRGPTKGRCWCVSWPAFFAEQRCVQRTRLG
jgi:hypothetical protein